MSGDAVSRLCIVDSNQVVIAAVWRREIIAVKENHGDVAFVQHAKDRFCCRCRVRHEIDRLEKYAYNLLFHVFSGGLKRPAGPVIGTQGRSVAQQDIVSLGIRYCDNAVAEIGEEIDSPVIRRDDTDCAGGVAGE